MKLYYSKSYCLRKLEINQNFKLVPVKNIYDSNILWLEVFDGDRIPTFSINIYKK